MTQSYTLNGNTNQTESGSQGGVRLLSSSAASPPGSGGTPEKSEADKSLFLVNYENGNNEKQEATGKCSEEACKKAVHWTTILWCFTTFVISVLDVVVIIYLSYLHFHHSSDIVAWLMLTPVLLNFVGIYSFLSDDEERLEMQSLGCQSQFWKNAMFFPIIGPSISSLKLFVLSVREQESERFERMESLVLRMKQYESFFRAAPEAFVQLTFRIISWSRAKVFHEEDYWTNLCLALCMFALTESNMYAPLVPYYRMFHREKRKDAWKIDHIRIPWRIILFFFTICSIESRLYADAIMKATACFYFHEYSFGEVLIVTFITQFVVRAGLYSTFVGSIGSERLRKRLQDRGVYAAFTYSWRSLFMNFDFQSFFPTVFLSFYIENLIMIGGSYVVIYTVTDVDLSDKYIFHVYAGLSLGMMVVAITFRIFLHRLQLKSGNNKVHSKEVEHIH